MSDASYISSTLSQYDTLVRNGLRDGDIVQKFEGVHGSIKKFYKKCSTLTEPDAAAAFKARYFLHRFIPDYKKNKDAPTFVEDQKAQLARFDVKNGPRQTVLLPGPMDLPPVADPSPRTVAPHHVAFPPTIPPQFLGTRISPPRMPPQISPPRTTFQQRKVSPPPPAIAGPGPRTLNNVANSQPLTFTRMNASDSEEPRDIEKRPKPADKKKGKNLKKRSADVPKDQDSDDDSDESWKGRKIVVSRPPRPDIGKMDPVHEPENVKKRREVQSTGELYDPPCSHCQALKIDCEKPDVGTACVKCRNVKHRCEYAQRVKGKETTKAVEAEDEEGKAKGRKKRPDAASEDEEGKTKGKKRRVPDASEDETEAPTVVPTRHAAKAATQAIQDILTAVTPPRQTSLPKKIKGKTTVKPKPAAAAQMAAILERVDNLTAIVVRLCDFLGAPLKEDDPSDARPVPLSLPAGTSSTPPRTYVEKSVDVYPIADPRPLSPPSLPTSIPRTGPTLTPPDAMDDIRPPTPLPNPIDTSIPDVKMTAVVPQVNLLQPTPVNSQEDASAGPLQLVPTPPKLDTSPQQTTDVPSSVPLPSDHSSLLPTEKVGESSPTSAVVRNSSDDLNIPVPGTSTSAEDFSTSTPAAAAVEVPVPLPRMIKTRSPQPAAADNLVVPTFTPRRTRSQSRSRSPSTRVEKRKAEDEELPDPKKPKL